MQIYFSLQASEIKVILMYAIFISFYVFQIFVPCYCAAILQDRLSRLSYTLFYSNWITAIAKQNKMDGIIQKSLILFQGQLMQIQINNLEKLGGNLTANIYFGNKYNIFISYTHHSYFFKFVFTDYASCVFTVLLYIPNTITFEV